MTAEGSSLPSIIKILLVDDDPTDASLIRAILTRQVGVLTIIDQTSCVEALATINQLDIDCVVMDQKLIGIQGSECVKQLRDSGYQGAFVLVTGFADDRVAVEAMKNGADDFISKNDIATKLLGAITGAIELRAHTIRTQHDSAERIAHLDQLIVQLDQILTTLHQERARH